MTEQEKSESGNPIYRYDNVKPKEFTPAFGEEESIDAILTHIEQNIGEIESVFHEVVSDLVHIDVYWVKPTKDLPFHALITSGMSDKPMTVPEGLEEHQFAELCILLPNSWSINEEAFKDENNYWPVRWLKKIARFPHEYDTWIGYGHTIPNGKHADPFAENTKFGCMLLLPSLTLGSEFYNLKINEEKTINFYCLYPLYKEEMDFKLKKGTNDLLDKFEKYHVLDVINLSRENTCLKKGLLGLW